MAKSGILDFAQQLYEEAGRIAQESDYDWLLQNTDSSMMPKLSQESIDAFGALSDCDKLKVWTFFADSRDSAPVDVCRCKILHASVERKVLVAAMKALRR